MFKGLILALILAASPAGAQSARPTDATVQAEVEKRLTKQDLAEGNDIEVRVDDLIVFLDGSVQNLRQMGIPLIVNTSSGIMNTDSGHREHSPERSDGLASQFIPSESRFSLF